MTEPTTDALEPALPHPPRFRWLIRFSVLYLLLIGALGGLRWWWGSVAERRLAATVAAAHARGEKILITDYTAPRPPLPDDQNAAVLLQRAQNALTLSSTEQWAIDNSTALPLREDVAGILHRVLQSHAAALRDVRAARQLERADWSVQVVSPMWSVLLPHLNRARQLCNVSRAAAIHAAHRGDHAAAVEHVRDILGISRALEQDNMFLVTHLVCVGISAAAADAAGEIARDLQVAGTQATPSGQTPASPQQVRELIAELLNDRSRQAAMQDALQGERAAQVDIGQQVWSRARLIRPAIQLDVVDLAKESQQLMQAATAADWPAAQKLLPVAPSVQGPRIAAHVVSQSVRAALGRAVLTTLRERAYARLAATSLAIRLYQADHGGQRPPTLAGLVPEYLPAIPLDPLAAGGKALGYVADPAAPYLYSVGDDGQDDSAGVPPWRPDETTTDPYRAPDLFLRLTNANAPPPEISDPPAEESDPTTAPAS